MAMKGRVARNEVLEQLLPLLWHGLTDKAIALIEETDRRQIKDQAIMEKLADYLHRNKPYIPCYAIRKQLGLRNSSNIGEKMNDLIVSDRQKHNGMSWSKEGSYALTALSAVSNNREVKRWVRNGTLSFKLVDKAAA